MIDNNIIQADIVTKLKANTALINWLTTFSAQAEVRESQFQGTVFVYPNVRVELGTQVEEGNPPCFSTVPFTVYSYSEKDSSREANELAGYVNDALLRQAIVGTGWKSGIIISGGVIAARRVNERVWQAVNLYQLNVYGGVL